MERPGVSVQLMCRASGNPVPKIVWYEASDIESDSSRLRPINPEDPRYTVRLFRFCPTIVSTLECKHVPSTNLRNITEPNQGCR